jgi:cytoskeleton protein RodZ
MTTIGQKLKEAREDQRLTIEKVFEATRIRVQYLQALEEDDLSIMPSPVQARGYLRNYAEFLGLNVEKMLEDMRSANEQKPSEEVIGPADVVDAEVTLNPEPVATEEVAPLDETTPLIKPKPARRKKADSQPEGDPVTTPKRRGRKKAQVESEPVVPIDLAVEPQPQVIEEPAVVEEIVVPEPEAVLEEASLPPVEESPQAIETRSQPDINDSLWQTWLNRLTSVLAARNKRPTLVPNENVIAEIEANPVLTEIEPQQETGPTEKRSTAPSTQIFIEIGEELRSRREMLSLHLDEVERNTHVKAHYLEALERGAMNDLPSTVQTRGMLSNYATFLDLDVDALLLRFADALQARHRERNPLKPTRKQGQPILANMPPMRSFIAGDLIFGVGIVILLVGFAIWGVNWVLTIQSQREVQPTAPSISDILLASPHPSSYTATPPYVPIESFPGEPTVTVVIPTLNVNVNVQVNLVAVERTYMRVIVDGETVFVGRVVPGTAYPFEAEDQVEVLVGSGAAIRIVYNGRDMGLLGSFGQVVSNIYLADSIITPTGIPSETPTITPTSTSTVPPTSTSRFTATPVLTSTPIP